MTVVIAGCCFFSRVSVIFQSMIGHCLGAAGGLEAIATVKAITTGWLHPTINQFVSATLSFTPELVWQFTVFCLLS